MNFEWDETKQKSNLTKHGIDFLDAVTIWASQIVDPAATRIVNAEKRHVALGVIGDDDIIIAVGYTFRNATLRIISARRARENEREAYKDKFGRGR